MRKKINIVWLDDRFTESLVKSYMKIVSNIIKELGYIGKFHEFENYDKAIEFSKEKRNRIDFFISDYNLTEEKNGLDFLIELREQYNYKQPLILYSAESETNIKSNIKNAFDSYDLKHLTNFHFFSSKDNDFKREIKQIMSFVLSKWNEINALRSFYISDHAELEGRLSLLFKSSRDVTDPTYSAYINRLKEFCRVEQFKFYNEELIVSWMKSKNERNALCHCKEDYEDGVGFYIESLINKKVKIEEANIIDYRKKMIDLYSEANILLSYIEKDYKDEAKEWSKDRDFDTAKDIVKSYK